ncbi:MAG: hypothetical protein WBM74_14245, partial [Polyangiales bacterium]
RSSSGVAELLRAATVCQGIAPRRAGLGYGEELGILGGVSLIHAGCGVVPEPGDERQERAG